MKMSHGPGTVREVSNVPEMADAGISLRGAKVPGTDDLMCADSVSCALPFACSYCPVCIFASGYQLHSQKIPALFESVPFLDSGTMFHSIGLDVIDPLLYSSQYFETLCIVGGHGSVCSANGQVSTLRTIWRCFRSVRMLGEITNNFGKLIGIISVSQKFFTKKSVTQRSIIEGDEACNEFVLVRSQ